MKVIITDCDHDNINIEKNIFNEAGIDFELKQAITEEAVISLCSEADVLVVQYAKITRKVMQNCPNLKYIVRYGVGVDTVDIKAATDLGIQVGNVPDYGMNEVADHAIAFALAFLRKIIYMNKFTKTDKLDYAASIPVYRFSELKIGVVGLGRIGSNFAKKMHSLGFKVLGYDRNKKTFAPELDFVEKVDFDTLLRESDVVSIHCPADKNINLFDKSALSKMKNTAILINTARGGIINETDLEWALENKKIAGACLDCMLNEPVDKKNSLFSYDNVFVTPHMAWYSEQAALELKRKVAEEVVRFVKGEPIHYPVNNVRR